MKQELGTILAEDDHVYISRIDFIDWLMANQEEFEEGHPYQIAQWLIYMLTDLGECPHEMEENHNVASVTLSFDKEDLNIMAIVDGDYGTYFQAEALSRMVRLQQQDLMAQFGAGATEEELEDMEEAVSGFEELMENLVRQTKEDY
jgi:hypothetical protein